MKSILIVFLALFFFLQPSHLNAQDTLSSKEFRSFLQKEYYFLANPNAKEFLSTFASLDSEDGEASFVGTFFLSKKDSILIGNKKEEWTKDVIMSIKVSGKGNKESLPIYNRGDFSSKVGLDIQLKIPTYNWRKNAKIEYSSDARVKNNIEELKTKTDYELKILKAENKADSIALVKLILVAKKNIREAKDKIENLKDKLNKSEKLIEKLNKNPISNRDALDSLKNDTTQIRGNMDIEKIKFIEEDLKIQETNIKLQNLPNKEDLIWIYEQERVLELREIKSSLPIIGHSVSWWSIGYGLENRAFKRFIPENSFENQIIGKDYLSHRFSASYSRSRILNSERSFYYNIGGSISVEDNFSKLKAVTINERTEYGPTPDDRYTLSETVALQGDYKTGLSTFSLFGNYYQFFLKDNNAAIHLEMEVDKTKSLNEQLNIGLGFLFTLTNSEDTKSVINAEFYIDVEDVFNTNLEEEKILDKSAIGIRFIVPFSKKK